MRPRLHADDVPLAAALALLVDDAEGIRETVAIERSAAARHAQFLQRLRRRSLAARSVRRGRDRSRGNSTPMLRALGREDRIVFPDFAMTPFLTGDEIAALAAIAPARASVV